MTDLDVPGTTRILDASGEIVDANNFTLVPEPSSDPEDPLNWSAGRKRIQLTCVVLYTIAWCFCTGCLAAIYEPVSAETGLSLADLNSGVGYVYLCLGIFQLFTQPLALSIGKRPVYIMGMLGSAVFPFWVTRVKSLGEWYGACVYLGFVGSPLFVLPELSLTDTFFYHERGLPLGIYVAGTYGGALGSPILSGFIYSGLGWKGPPYFAGGAILVVALILIVFLEETNFRRVSAPVVTMDQVHNQVGDDKNVTLHTVTAVDEKTNEKATDIVVEEQKHNEYLVHSRDRLITPWPGPRPWKMFTISPNARGLMWRGILYPLCMLRLPIILWCGVIFALYQVFYNGMVALSSGVLGAEPYNMAPNMVGLSFVSPLIAIIPGAVAGGYIVDRFTIRQARRNHGISEAEHKLKLMIFPTVLAPLGLLMIGLGPYYRAHWIVFVLGEFVLTISGPLATLLSLTYAFDSFHDLEPEEDKRNGPQAETQHCGPYVQAVILIALTITFAFNYVITPWAFGGGFLVYGTTAAAMATVINLTYLLMLKYGKRLRQSGAPYYRKIINW
ncbi:hypothetical protein CspeluHIS016_0101370 [Cutaneotrichosporon spelunceum]|uniref:MFS general substrate transporter n=1 Tax=Cutaneotrichosporon spelunceum TaxID=1672016 RepID=A0AAD3TNG9_9TREE|nr:hypothetical protein CspeluHIS016_0101370 [Cutaneotrichosporon spelunceum]